MKQRLRSSLGFVLKLGFGTAVLLYVFRSQMIDMRSVKSLVFSPWNFSMAMAFLSLNVLLCSYRWGLLTRALGVRFSYWRIVELNMIGSFFNTFMPGAVGGDLIKAWYVAGHQQGKRSVAVFSVLLDRVIGLSVIIFYAAITLVLYSKWTLGRPELMTLGVPLWVFSSVALLGVLFFFLSRRIEHKPRWIQLKTFVQKHTEGTSLGSILQALNQYRNHALTLVCSVLISATCILLTTLFYRLQGGFLHISMDLPQYFFVVPVCIIASAIPLLPGGIGVGQVAFFSLFKWMEIPNPELGGALCTVVQIYTLLFNCLGFIFYLRFKKGARILTDTSLAHPA